MKAAVARIDIDVYEEDRDEVFRRIITRIGMTKTAHVFALGTNQALGAIDDIGRALARKWVNENGKDTKELKIQKRKIQHSALTKEERKAQIDAINEQIKEIDKFNDKLNNPYSLKIVSAIKKLWQSDEQQCREKYPELCYYMDGIVDVKISASQHPAGLVASPITLSDSYGIMYNDGSIVLQLDMDAAHEVGLIKYDVLGLKTVGVIKKAYQSIGKNFPRMHEVDWNDQAVWDSINNDNTAIFQYESAYAGQLLKTMNAHNLFDMSLVNAMIRPSGASYREDLSHRIIKHNPDPRIDKLLENNLGYLVYQEDIIAFLQQICGLSGSAADTVRRAIGQKRKEVIDEWMPKILEGYCNGSDKPRAEAEKEANDYLKVIEDASSYSFGYNHSIAYCMLGYLCGYLRYHYPEAFICAFLNCAKNDDDIINGTKLANDRNIKIEEPIFRYGHAEYSFNNNQHIVYKGMASIKYMNQKVSEQLFLIGKQQYDNFFEVLRSIKNKTSVNARQLDLLIKLNFFKEFGNIKKLMKYVELFDMFKQGDISVINRGKINSDTIWKVVTRIAEVDNDIEKVNIKKTKANGCVEIFKELSELLDCMDIKEFSFKDRIAWQKEFLGYINLTTGLDEDRKKLFITSMRPIIAKKGRSAGKAWCRIITTHSLGRGIDGEWWVLEGTYQKYYRFNEGDIIIAGKVRPEKYQDKKQWWLDSYELCID